MESNIKIGLFGFGVVGQGLYHIMQNNKNFKADIIKIAIKDKNKKRTIANGIFTYDKYEILHNPEINLIVELIDDSDEAYRIARYAMRKGKNVVTANKKMVATYLKELYNLSRKYNVSLLYEASTCASIPVIRTIEEYFSNESIKKISGIFNGTTNYILTKTILEKLSYKEALKQAQRKGFAETDSTSDVEGFDTKYKTIIVAFHAFGIFLKLQEILCIGITTLNKLDINYANDHGYKIKLIPTIIRSEGNKIVSFVLPTFIEKKNDLYNVDNEFNAVEIEGQFSGKQFFKGKGAGSYPTGAAVLSDISALSRGYKYKYDATKRLIKLELSKDALLRVYFRYKTAKDIVKMNFSKIIEQCSETKSKYVIGNISLENIRKNREFILKNNLFIAVF